MMVRETTSIDVDRDTMARNINDENPSNTRKLSLRLLEKMITVDEDLIGRYVVVECDGLPYPGEVLDVDDDNLEAKVVHKIGRNCSFLAAYYRYSVVSQGQSDHTSRRGSGKGDRKAFILIRTFGTKLKKHLTYR